MELKIQAWAQTDPGLKRRNNEDALLCDPAAGFFLVCDGMGGQAAGEVASSEAIRIIRDQLVQHPDWRAAAAGRLTAAEREQALERLRVAVLAANVGLYEMAGANLRLRGMGTTASLLVIRGDRGFLAHVGDSRIYLRRSGELHRLTQDHTFVAELAARRHQFATDLSVTTAFKNALTRAVGVQAAVEVDVAEFELLPGDRLLLCSDGLHRYLGEDSSELLHQLDQPGESPANLPTRLITWALEQGGEDNISVIVVEVESATASKTLLDLVKLEYQQAVNGICKAELFKYLLPHELLEVLAIAEECEFARGETIFQQGEPGDAMYVVLAGLVDVVVDGVQVSTLGPGHHFGELALVAGIGRSASVVAVKDVKLKRLRREPFNQLLAHDLQLTTKVLWNMVAVLARQTQEINREMVRLQTKNERLRAKLQELSPEGVDEGVDEVCELTLV